MRQTLIIVFLLAYLIAALAAPLAYSLYIEQNTFGRFAIVCACGCDGSPQKCTCHLASSAVTFTPCSTGADNILLPERVLSPVIIDIARDNVSADRSRILCFPPQDDEALPGFDVLIDHPPRV